MNREGVKEKKRDDCLQGKVAELGPTLSFRVGLAPAFKRSKNILIRLYLQATCNADSPENFYLKKSFIFVIKR